MGRRVKEEHWRQGLNGDMGEDLNSELELKVMYGWELACLWQGSDRMRWFSPFAGVCASGVRSVSIYARTKKGI